MNANELKEAVAKLPEAAPDLGLVYISQIEGQQRLIADAEASIRRQKALLLNALQEDWTPLEIRAALGDDEVSAIIQGHVVRGVGNQGQYRK